MSDFELRFAGIGRLFGVAGLARLRAAHVMVVGVGGVGSWVVEALARSGIGFLTLIDLDEICVSNVNRQLPALNGAIGRPKVEVLAERVKAIQPEVRAFPLVEFFTADNADMLLDRFQAAGGGFVVDAIDSAANKCRLITGCHLRRLPLITCGAAGGRTDPLEVRISDLAQVTHDRLLGDVRRRLRREAGLVLSGQVWGIPAVHSAEAAVISRADGTVCAVAEVSAVPGESRRLNCDQGFGSATFVTGAFGFVAASHVVRQLARNPGPMETPAAFSSVQQPPGTAMKGAVET